VTQPSDTPEPNETAAPVDEPPAPKRGPITGPRAAAAVLAISFVVMLLIVGRIAWFEAAFAVALVISERDHRIRWVRYALVVFIAYGLFMTARVTLATGDWVNLAAVVAWAGGFGALSYLEDDLPKIAVVFAVSLAGLVGVYFA
jgi:hypothetical protein